MGERSPLRHYAGRGSDPSSIGDDLSENDGFLPSNPDAMGSVGYEAVCFCIATAATWLSRASCNGSDGLLLHVLFASQCIRFDVSPGGG